MWTSATGSSTAKMKHLRQLERNRRHQNRETRSIQDQIRKLRIRVKDGPFSNNTGSNSNAKNGPKMKHTSKKAPRRKYYRPSDDTKTFQINSKGHLQCVQDPKLIHRPNDKGKLPGSTEASIYHEPGRIKEDTYHVWREDTGTSETNYQQMMDCS